MAEDRTFLAVLPLAGARAGLGGEVWHADLTWMFTE
jgi:hypothetical protein